MTVLTAQSVTAANHTSTDETAVPSSPERRDSATIEHRGDFGWRSYLSGLAVEAAIILCDLRGKEGGRHIFMVGIDQGRSNVQFSDALVTYAECVWGALPAMPFQTYPIGSPPVFCEDDRARLRRVGQANGIALSQFLSRYSHAAVMHANTGANSTSALLFRTKSAGPFTELERHSLLEALPLFQDGAIAHAHSVRSEQRAALLSAMFDQVSLATLLVNASGRPVFENEVAQQMLSERRFILKSADGTIACASTEQTKKLRNAIRTAATSGREAGQEISLRIGECEGDWRLAVVVPASTMVGERQLRCAMLLIHGPRHVEAPSHMLKALGLLPSEQRFLEAFLSTNSLAEAARSSGLSEESARTYLKRVRAKLGVHRQLELARLIYGLVPPIRMTEAQAAE